MTDARRVFLDKAAESLTGAEYESAGGRYNNAANRCYYACYQAAVFALHQAGVRTPGGVGARWSHPAVQAQFVGLLINRRKLYPSDLRDVLAHSMALRQTADYEDHAVSEVQAARSLRNARRFVTAVRRQGETS